MRLQKFLRPVNYFHTIWDVVSTAVSVSLNLLLDVLLVMAAYFDVFKDILCMHLFRISHHVYIYTYNASAVDSPTSQSHLYRNRGLQASFPQSTTKGLSTAVICNWFVRIIGFCYLGHLNDILLSTLYRASYLSFQTHQQ